MWLRGLRRREQTMKVTVVGAGMVGSTTALRLLDGRIADSLAVIDVVEGLAKAVALDLAQSAPLRGHSIDVTGGSDYAPTEGSDLVIITAGLPRKPGQSRADLLQTNAEIVGGVVEETAWRSPGAILLIVTNPLDEMTTLASQVSGFPRERVIGMAGALDTARFRYFVAAELETAPDRVDAIVLGSHGETMVPLPRLTRAGGRPLPDLLPPERIAALVEQTRDAGAEIVALLPRGSAWMAPSAAIADMARAVARNERRVVSACARLDGEYGLSGMFLGVPVRLGRRGVEEIVELRLLDDELTLLRTAAETVRARAAELNGGTGLGQDGSPAVAGPPGAAGRGTSRAESAMPQSLRAIRTESRVRQAVGQVLWQRGRPSAQDIENLTRAVIERIGSG
jgi:malate dehydrogenase